MTGGPGAAVCGLKVPGAPRGVTAKASTLDTASLPQVAVKRWLRFYISSDSVSPSIDSGRGHLCWETIVSQHDMGACLPWLCEGTLSLCAFSQASYLDASQNEGTFLVAQCLGKTVQLCCHGVFGPDWDTCGSHPGAEGG
jgi:hypothetical protein